MTNEKGFTLVEMLIATMVLAVGVLALASSSGTVTRMVARGRSETVAVQIAERRIAMLRARATSTNPRCTHASLAAGTTTATTQGLAETTAVTLGPNLERNVAVTVAYKVGGATKTAAMSTSIFCG